MKTQKIYFKIYLIIGFMYCHTICSSQIISVKAYHIPFLHDYYSGGPVGDGIKEYDPKIYISTHKKFLKKLDAFLNSIDTCRKETEFTSMKNVKLLLEITYQNGEEKKLYAWFTDKINFNNQYYKSNPYFRNLIEKYFKKISWSDDVKDTKYNH